MVITGFSSGSANARAQAQNEYRRRRALRSSHRLDQRGNPDPDVRVEAWLSPRALRALRALTRTGLDIRDRGSCAQRLLTHEDKRVRATLSPAALEQYEAAGVAPLPRGRPRRARQPERGREQIEMWLPESAQRTLRSLAVHHGVDRGTLLSRLVLDVDSQARTRLASAPSALAQYEAAGSERRHGRKPSGYQPLERRRRRKRRTGLHRPR